MKDYQPKWSFVFRAATPDDHPQIIALWRRFMQEEREAVPDADGRAAEAGWAARLQQQIARGQVFVVAHGQTLIGFLGFIDHADREWIPAGAAYVGDLYVVPEARSLHTARELFRVAAAQWRETYSETWTNTHVGNRRMQVLLQRAGFRAVADFAVPGLKDQRYYRLDNYAVQPTRARARADRLRWQEKDGRI